MKIKKVDGRPMVIHLKERTKLHVKDAPEVRLKGKAYHTESQGMETARADVEENTSDVCGIKTKIKLKPEKAGDKKQNSSFSGNCPSAIGEKEFIGTGRKKRRKDAHIRCRRKQDKENPIKKKNNMAGPFISVGAKASLDQIEGGEEVYRAYMSARELSRPLENAASAGGHLYHKMEAAKKEERIKKVREGKRVYRKKAGNSAVKEAKKTSKAAVKRAVEGTEKAAAEAVAVAGSATMGPGGILAGAAAGEAARISLDRKNMKSSARNRMIQFFIAKLRQEGNQDSIGNTLKDIMLMRFSMFAKYALRYTGVFLLAVVALVSLMALPVIVVLAVIYSSPFAVFLPSISSGDTTQDVLSAYVSEFNNKISHELAEHPGFDSSEKIYLEIEGVGEPDNYCDILAVYMVEFGKGDTATDMTDGAKKNLKSVFNDMCSYSITSRSGTVADNGGNATPATVKVVNVELKNYHDMAEIYGFDAEEQELLAELMKPEYMAVTGHSGGGGGSGKPVSPGQYQAVVDAVSDANGKKVVEYALSKVGYPYSQDYRNSGNYFDCSSLAYYAWKNAGIDIMYEGANTAAAEGKFCYDKNYLVNYEEMQPGDLIFYSYSKNGRFYDITHVAIYVGDGKVVEAANERLGVVYRPVNGKSSIVFIGRPR